MARTSRGGAPATPAMDAGALDDLDLDDMFAEDGDTLFEGLDIQLDGMGDIINNEQKEQKVQKTDPPKRGSGPKTKKSNPLLEESAAEPEAPKRRKTKRKSKAPTAFGDDDDNYVEDVQPKKKQRKSASKSKTAGPVTPPAAQTKKKKPKKGEAAPAISSSSSPTKTKKGTGGIPPPGGLSRGSSATVAAAGQFGGRLKRGSALPTNKVKRKLKGLSPTASAPAAAAATTAASAAASQPPPTPLPVVPPAAAPIKLPKPEPTYGGLAPSKTYFYPFMEAVPPEPSMKNRKSYPILDRIGSSLTSHLNAATPQEPAPEVTMDSPIFRLIVESYEGGNDKERAGFTPEKRLALLHAIPKLREGIGDMERQKLVSDLYAMCGLLARQHGFLKQTLQNMKDWCKTEFTPQDFNATYVKPVPPTELAPVGQPTAPRAELAKWSSPFIKVKVICSAYKEQKGTPPLQALLPPHVVVVPPAKPTPTPPTKTKKKKEKTTEKPKAAPAATATPTPAPTVKSYAECAPVDRRQRISNTVSQLALQLEEQELKIQHTQKPPEPLPDEEPALHTARMWQWLDSAGFYNSLPANGLDMQSPEIHPRGLFLTNPTKIQGHDDRVDEISSNSLFDRLQSLLVEVDREKDEGIDDLPDDEQSGDDESLGFLDDDDDNDDSEAGEMGEMADLSNLSIEERTFLVLRSVGLIQDSVFPMVELVLSSNEDEKKVKAEDDLVNVIGKMSNDLSRLTTRNNSRFAFLESTLSTSDQLSSKPTEEEQASIIARCQSLLKRSKEKAKKMKLKKDDNLNLPW
jgi:hypothetical protein